VECNQSGDLFRTHSGLRLEIAGRDSKEIQSVSVLSPASGGSDRNDFDQSMHGRRANSQYPDDQKYGSSKSDLAKDVSEQKASGKVLVSRILRLDFSNEPWLQD
jgi:hypothetical protein